MPTSHEEEDNNAHEEAPSTTLPTRTTRVPRDVVARNACAAADPLARSLEVNVYMVNETALVASNRGGRRPW